jgi:hypothetical protein
MSKNPKFRGFAFGRPFAAALVLCATGVEALAADGISGTGDIKLGAIPRYADEAAAREACAPDGVVWADSKTGFFYPKFSAEYGATPHGVFTCYRKAEQADYWSISPVMEGGFKGREFPLRFCNACS